MVRVLLGQGNVASLGVPSRSAARFTIQHEGQQALNFGFAGHQLQKHAREPHRFLGQIAPALVGPRHVVPAEPESGVDRFEHGVKALRQITLWRDFERNATTADFCLRAKKALPHGFRCDEKGLGNTCCIQTQDRLQHERCVHRGVDRRVSADEKQFEAFIRKLGGQGSLRGVLCEELKRWLALQYHLLVTNHINERMARRCQQPRLRIFRHPILRPMVERRH